MRQIGSVSLPATGMHRGSGHELAGLPTAGGHMSFWESGTFKNWECTMDLLTLAIIALIVAVIAGIFGFRGAAGTAATIAKVLFVVFLIVAVVAFLL